MTYHIIKKEYQHSEPFNQWLSIRSKTLQKFVYLHWLLTEEGSSIRKKIRARQMELVKKLDEKDSEYGVLRHGLANQLSVQIQHLKPSDIMTILNCCRRTAVDYLHAMRAVECF